MMMGKGKRDVNGFTRGCGRDEIGPRIMMASVVSEGID